MKIRSRILIAILVLLVGGLTQAQTQRRPTGFVFESQPRAVMAENEVVVSRHAKLALRVNNLHMLTIYGAEKGQSQLGLTVRAGTVGRVFVSWTEATDNGTQVMLSRARRSNGSATASYKTESR